MLSDNCAKKSLQSKTYCDMMSSNYYIFESEGF